jgi:hypothetical protein
LGPRHGGVYTGGHGQETVSIKRCGTVVIVLGGEGRLGLELEQDACVL